MSQRKKKFNVSLNHHSDALKSRGHYSVLRENGLLLINSQLCLAWRESKNVVYVKIKTESEPDSTPCRLFNAINPLASSLMSKYPVSNPSCAFKSKLTTTLNKWKAVSNTRGETMELI